MASPTPAQSSHFTPHGHYTREVKSLRREPAEGNTRKATRTILDRFEPSALTLYNNFSKA